jgi:oligopeptide transport system substrate-binding protein
MFVSTVRHLSRNHASALVSALVVALVLAGCGGSDTADSSTDGETSFVAAVPSFFVTNLTPGSSGSSYVDYAVFTPLTQIDSGTGELVNAVAESLESEDQRVWTIRLKDGWTFHDGSPVTAQSFADSWNATADPANAMSGNFAVSIFEGYAEMNPTEGKATAKTLSGVKVVDDLTLEVTLNEPNALLPHMLASSTFAPLPESALADLKNFGTHPVGNGPYMLRDGGWKTGDQDIYLKAYEDYAGEPAKTDEVDLRVYQDTGTVYTDFQAGTVDLALLDGSDLADAKASYDGQVVDVQFPAVVYLGFPLYDKRFANPEVRKAISMAINREAIVDSLLQGLAVPATGLAPETLVGAGDVECSSCMYEPDTARQMLEAAGGWDGPMTLYTYQDPTNERVLEGIANQIRTTLGVEDVQFKALEIGQLYEKFAAKSSDGPSLAYAGASYPHIYAMADQMLRTGAFLNITGYDEQEFNALLDEAASASELDKTTELTQQAVETALEATPIAPLYWPQGGLAHAENLSNVEPEFLGGARLSRIEVG